MMEDDVELENNCIVPSQFADEHRKSMPFQGERRMWAAAFESHLKDTQYVCKGGHLGQSERSRRQAEALDWVHGDGNGPLTFRWYCDVLGFDATAVRKAVAAGLPVFARMSPVRADPPLNLQEYHRRYRDKHRERLRKYNTEYGRERRAAR
jgi:hypothetical protein